MAYIAPLNIWADIYLQSGTGESTVSSFSSTITKSRIWNDHVDDLASVNKRLPNDLEFQILAKGSNSLTSIAASSATTGGKSDSAGRRLISSFFLEDCCGSYWQWLSDQAVRWDASSGTGFSWRSLAGNAGNVFSWSDNADIKLVAGGDWNSGVNSGPRSRGLYAHRNNISPSVTARGVSQSLNLGVV